jgi:MoaA/NifB/PqqE/SkfB family radical SAM enzyme
MLRAAVRFLSFGSDVRLPSADLRNASLFFTALDKFQNDAFIRLRVCYPKAVSDSFCRLVALKIANALAADFHFRQRHSSLVSRPIQLQVDPTNVCHMHCPACLHSANTAWASRFDWPSATLSVGEFEEFCNEFGPYATSIALFRDGEPLLHRRFPEFVAAARSHLLYTVTSTSLSTRIDAEALVASGLDRLVAAIDGATSATYSRYRRGGDFGLVLDNLRNIVRARKAQSTRKPWLVWQFLAFEHNVHEVELAGKLAREIGIDELVVAKPFSVEHDEPGVKVADSAPFGETVFSKPRNWCLAQDRISAAQNAECIERIFNESWADRYSASGDRLPSGENKALCSWLYYSLTMDAARRVTPCCLPPMGLPEPRHLVYSTFSGKTEDVVNSLDAVMARRHCRRAPVEVESSRPLPYCISCTENPPPPMLPDVSAYVNAVDELRALPAAIHARLAASPLFTWPSIT